MLGLSCGLLPLWSLKSPPHTAGPAPDLQSQLRPFHGLDLQHQLQQLNISQCSGGDTSPAVVVPPLQTQLHHGCSVVVPNAVTNGNPVHGQSNMAAPDPLSVVNRYLRDSHRRQPRHCTHSPSSH